MKKDDLKRCEDCIHEHACRIWTDGRYISDSSASKCPQYTTVKDSAPYYIGKMDGRKEIVRVETNCFDKETVYENCTVQVLENTVTKEISVGWWRNKKED